MSWPAGGIVSPPKRDEWTTVWWVFVSCYVKTRWIRSSEFGQIDRCGCERWNRTDFVTARRCQPLFSIAQRHGFELFVVRPQHGPFDVPNEGLSLNLGTIHRHHGDKDTVYVKFSASRTVVGCSS